MQYVYVVSGGGCERCYYSSYKKAVKSIEEIGDCILTSKGKYESEFIYKNRDTIYITKEFVE